MSFQGHPVRVLIVPGLRSSGPAHWQTWLQAHWRNARRVEQRDWTDPDLAAWSARIGETLAAEPPGDWVVAAHSFGCLALAHHLANTTASSSQSRIGGALLVAPADPSRFGLDAVVPRTPLGVPGTLIGSETDPWMRADQARDWARDWSLAFVNLGDAGHINVDSGFGPLPAAKQVTQGLIHRIEQSRRWSRVSVHELSFAI